ncbi:DUF4157 domain-containing protein [Aureisphaera galaxeae]|uniref:eCIS core domain-containing protein n=1 Tax=Aureisphaera galaxeae TaxID=1538023 RepID=UPI0023502EE4|nr:DUF4157 domain-containing protein [Aureisphaera galaxeae]MDC8005364.1 DUF4157 domain-containing protein [Aureisphaera galaxeae]
MQSLVPQHKKQPSSKNSSFVPPAPTIQKKLGIGASNDPYEVEADQVADKVVRMQPSPKRISTQKRALVQRKCSACAKEEKIQKKSIGTSITPLIQKKGVGAKGGTASKSLSQQIHTSKGSGSKMDRGTRDFMENRFETDFSEVNIHTGPQAIQMSRELNAQAFTVGNDIYFNKGKYNPSSTSGKHLLAHELTHTIQQGGIQRKMIQRDFALEPPNPDAECNDLTEDEVNEAIRYNQRQRYQERDIRLMRDVLGVSPEPVEYDAAFINAIACFQAQNNLDVDGKIGPTTGTTIGREVRAEGQFLGRPDGNDLLAAARRLCADGYKTVTIDFVRLDGATRSPTADLAVANRVFRQCCVRFVMRKNVRASAADTRTWLGGDTDLNLSGITCPTPTVEERTMYTQATATHSLSSDVRVFYPASTSGYAALAFSRPPYCAGGFSHHAVIYPGALRDTLAHELGHIFLNSGTHAGIRNPASTRNLMFAPGRTASVLDRDQCRIIRGNV